MDACPPEDEILRGLIEEVSPEARAALTAHLTRCERCRERWQHHRSLGYGPPDENPTPPSTPPCRDPADVEALVRGRLPPVDARDARQHALSCPHCYARLDAALRVERRHRQEDEGTNTAGLGAGFRRWLRRLRGEDL